METEGQDINAFQASSLNRITPLSKYLAMVLFVTMPFIGGWIGYTFAPEKIVEVEKIVFRENIDLQAGQQNSNPVIISQIEPATTSIEIEAALPDPSTCFSDGLTHYISDTQNWIQSTGTRNLFFETIQPSTISIVESADYHGYGADYNNYLLRDSTTGLEANISVIDLQKGTFSFGSKYFPLYTYEPFSNAFWESQSYSEYPRQCTPKNSSRFGEKNFVFVIRDGDAGSFRVDYNVILRPTIEAYEKYDCNRPVAITISYWGDWNDPEHDQSGYDKFEATIATMILNMKIQPVCKG